MSLGKVDGQLVFQAWKPDEGLTERRVVFDSLEKLFCALGELEIGETVDRILLSGVGKQGDAERVVLAYQGTRYDSALA